MKRAKRLRTVVTGVCIAAAGICYSLFAPSDSAEIEILKGQNTEVIALGYTTTPVPVTPTSAAQTAQTTAPAAQTATPAAQTATPKAELLITSPAATGSEAADNTSEKTAETGTTAGEGQKLVNINTASAEELISLPGIGETRAAAIIGYRAVHGEFHSIEDIMLVSGIKEGVFSKIKNRICTGYE